MSLHAGVPVTCGIAGHVSGVSLERDDQQGGCKDEHDQRNEDPHLKENSQVGHIGLSGDFFLSGVGGGDRNVIVTVHSVDVFEEEHTGAQGNKHG